MVNMILKIISLLALIVLILPSLMYLAGRITLEQTKAIMLIATVVWFVSAGIWMWKSDSAK